MNDFQFFKRWKAIKEKGRFRYALVNGVKYGIFLTILMNVIKMTKGLSFYDSFLNLNILLEIVLFSLFGTLIFGSFMWWLNNYFYSKKTH